MYRRILIVPLLSFALVVLTPFSALAAKKPPKGHGDAGGTGYDVSYPQCSGALPPSPLFGIVGVNNGIVYSANPCLATECAGAANATTTTRPKVSFYANTANPGPASS